jgi:hypothetical protein
MIALALCGTTLAFFHLGHLSFPQLYLVYYILLGSQCAEATNTKILQMFVLENRKISNFVDARTYAVICMFLFDLYA